VAKLPSPEETQQWLEMFLKLSEEEIKQLARKTALFHIEHVKTLREYLSPDEDVEALSWCIGGGQPGEAIK